MPFHFGILERTCTVVMRDHWGYHWPLLWVIILGDGHWGDTEGTFDVAYEDSAVYSAVFDNISPVLETAPLPLPPDPHIGPIPATHRHR